MQQSKLTGKQKFWFYLVVTLLITFSVVAIVIGADIAFGALLVSVIVFILNCLKPNGTQHHDRQA